MKRRPIAHRISIKLLLLCSTLAIVGIFLLMVHSTSHCFLGDRKARESFLVPVNRSYNNSPPTNSIPVCNCLEENKLELNQNQSYRSSTQYYYLAVLILSGYNNQDRRDTIRNTWKNGYKQRSYYTKFVIGTHNLLPEHMHKLRHEESVHHDMLYLPDLVDTYQNLSHKLLDSFVWMDQNVNYSYLLKCDDDSFAQLDMIEDELQQRTDTRGLYWGYFIGNAYPKSTGPWAENRFVFCDTYFPYAFGGGYVLSADVVHRVVLNADGIIVFNNEDVTVGAWTVIFDIERKHDVRFDTEEISRGCKNSFLVTHKQSIEDMTNKHKLFLETGKICDKESVRGEFVYNWGLPPSKCYDTK